MNKLSRIHAEENHRWTQRGRRQAGHTLAFRMSLDETLDCGDDTGAPVSENYQAPFDEQESALRQQAPGTVANRDLASHLWAISLNLIAVR
jgi:hypothetical protein